MPCCAAAVVLRRSPRGTPYFAHKATDDCGAAPESEAHLRLKRMAVEAARRNGWDAETEVDGGGWWRADVLATSGRHKVAVEIQWSGQPPEETLRRQERYRESGVRGLWLLRQPSFPVSRALPAACIGGNLDEGFQAMIPRYAWMTARDRARADEWRQAMPMDAFLDAVFQRRFRFGVPLGAVAQVRVEGAHYECWRPGCSAQTRIVTWVVVACGPNERRFTVAELAEHPALLEHVRRKLPSDRAIGAIKPRYSQALRGSYVSNGCFRCDALVDQFHEHEVWGQEQELCSFAVAVDEAWRRAVTIDADGESLEAWGVYPAASLSSAS